MNNYKLSIVYFDGCRFVCCLSARVSTIECHITLVSVMWHWILRLFVSILSHHCSCRRIAHTIVRLDSPYLAPQFITIMSRMSMFFTSIFLPTREAASRKIIRGCDVQWRWNNRPSGWLSWCPYAEISSHLLPDVIIHVKQLWKQCRKYCWQVWSWIQYQKMAG